MAATTQSRNGNGTRNGTRRNGTRRRAQVTSIELPKASAWISKGNDPDNQRVMVKLPGIPLFAVPQGTSAEVELWNMLV